ncbi:uncharacterized protein LOC124327678 [Daphnia pulicaria]|uniref:uncharacterized protein LOC124327678 n=1 Tax=Daphnia pulicaria TaxID=35523 RepID=UPI001EEAA674|nr:uncharacterized protein LOC124327678 [Daphnia pulicaria]
MCPPIDRDLLLALKSVGEQLELLSWTPCKNHHSLWQHNLLRSSFPRTRRSYRGGRAAVVRFEARCALYSVNPYQFARPATSKEKKIPPRVSVPRLGLLNARSVCKRKHDIADLIISSGLDFLAITETWLNVTHGDHILKSACPPGYMSLHVPRLVAKKKKGGGVGLVFRASFNVRAVHLDISLTSFELLCVQISSSTKTIRLYVIYRPPERPGFPSFSTFLSEFRTLLEFAVDNNEEPVIVGDFNIHVDDSNCNKARSFNQLVEELGWNQLVLGRTHSAAHTLDLILTRSGSKFVSDVQEIRGVVESHAPLKTSVAVLRDPAPWINSDILVFRHKLRRAERIWRGGGYLQGHFESYKCLRSEYRRLLFKVKADYLCSTIADCSGDQKKLYKIVDSWLGRSKERSLPTHQSSAKLANAFSSFYSDKVDAIKDELIGSRARIDPTSVIGSVHFLDTRTDSDLLTEFSIVSIEEVHRVIVASPTKSCGLDPIPTGILKKVAPLLVPAITSIVNLSFQTGVFPQIFKHGLITPLLKKPALDKEVFSNYRPVTNLSFLSKVLERLAAHQLDAHLASHEILSPTQYAYRPNHSTETALLALQNDLLQAASQGHGCVVLLLDLTAAFDTIDHEILLDRISSHCGIDGKPLAWIASYLRNRTQSVIVDGVESVPVQVKYGVPQGSVLGPKLYTIYVNCLRLVAERYGISIEQYSDDTAIYLEFGFSRDCLDQFDALRILSECAGDLIDWFSFNWVKLNPSKSEVLYFAPSELAGKLAPMPFRVGDNLVTPTTSAKVLGVHLSSDLTMDRQISAISRAANFNLYRLGKIRSHLTTEATKILVHSLVISHLDYANSLLAGLSKEKLRPLQSVQDSAARLIHRGVFSTEESRFRLHWLPIHYRILFKVLLLVFDCLQGTAPVYLQECVALHVPGRAGLRAEARSLRVVASTRTRGKKNAPPKPAYQKRSFISYAPHYWNELPPAIRSTSSRQDFKKLLKTHFFTLSYPFLTARH